MTVQANFPNVLPSLLLDFANAKKLDPRVTFTRATTAAYYDDNTTAMAEQNILLYSQEFNNAIWSKTLGTMTANQDVAPDGTTTADLFTPSDIASRFDQAYTPLSTSQHTFSIWLRSATGSSFSTELSSWRSSPFTITGNTTITVTTTWQRFTLAVTPLDSSTHFVVVGGANTLSVGENLYVWGAQLEQRSSATAYTATTSQAITNYIPVLLTAGGGQPRFDHNPTTRESLGLLIEEQRTNISSYSEAPASGGWSLTPASATNNTIISPGGTLTGASLIENGSNTYQRINRAFTVTAGTTYTQTVYAKKGLRNWLTLDSGPTAYYNLDTGTVGSVGAGVTASMTSVGNGWYRCVYTYTNPTTTLSCYIGSSSNGSDGGLYTGVAGYQAFYFWGFQVEAGSVPTSYIPTTNAAATRAADYGQMTGTNFSSWFNLGEGTFYSELSLGNLGTDQTVLGVNNSNSYGVGNGMLFRCGGSTTSINYGGYNSAAGATLSPAATVNVSFKMVGKYQVSTKLQAAQGNAGTVGTSSTLDYTGNGTNQLQISGYRYSSEPLLVARVKKIAYYPVAVSDSQMQALTS